MYLPSLFLPSFPPSLPFLLALLSVSKEKAFSQERLKDHFREPDLCNLPSVVGAIESWKESFLKADGPAVFVTTFFFFYVQRKDFKVFVNVREYPHCPPKLRKRLSGAPLAPGHRGGWRGVQAFCESREGVFAPQFT